MPAPVPTRVDLIPKPANQPGYPPCGFYTYTQTIDGQLVTFLDLAIAVLPYPPFDTGSRGQFVTVRYDYDAPPGYEAKNDFRLVDFDRTGEIANGSPFTPPGASFFYVSMDLNQGLPTDNEWLRRTTTITATVDPLNKIRESDEKNNTLTLRVTPPKRSNIKITDNRCTVVG
jgi:hypothetical protein